MKKLAIFTATPNGVNPGMLAGEAVAKSFFVRAGLLGDVEFFKLLSIADHVNNLENIKNICASCDFGINFNIFTSDNRIDDYKSIFWGDFQHMRRYIKAISKNNPVIESAYRKIILLEGAKNSTIENAISYGTSILFNSTSEYLDLDYGVALERFLSKVSHIQMRDSVSSCVVTNYRRQPSEPCGIDPVQLLSIPEIEENILLGFERTPTINRALVFFARAQHCENDTVEFLSELNNALGTSCHWLSWGDQFSFPFMQRQKWPWQTLALNPDPFGRGVLAPLLAAIRNSKFVVTDTYHLAVSSWAMGVPAVVVVGSPHNAERLDKEFDIRMRLDKRTLLMAQDGLLDFCIDPVHLIEANRAYVINRLAKLLDDSRVGINFRRRLSERAYDSEKRLLAAIFN